MRYSRSTLIILMLICLLTPILPASANNVSLNARYKDVTGSSNESETDEGIWRRFRNAFPYHIQTLAFDKKSRTLIISEPPPHVTPANLKEAIQRYNQQLDPSMEIKRMPVGVDGWVKDILLQLPPMDEAQTREALDAIHLHVFHTNYKAHVMEVPDKKPPLYSDKLDLIVSIAEIRKWLFDDNERFSPLLGNESQTANELLTSRKSGVYLSRGRGLVVWSVNRRRLISEYLIEARQFALDADIIIGAISSADHILIIGRERIVPVEVLPPLRAETVMLLASVGDVELQQSYERTHIFAGRFNEKQDWAPILLSDVLIDTEYGSLLNITDQLLKRWSMNGFIEYENFEYPDPKSWCFQKPLFEEVGASTLTFNWNTRGVGYTTEVGGLDFFAVNRTGSLPTSYLEGADKAGYSKQEEDGYDCFARFGDPNLARVVQYATLYQIFQKYPVRRAQTFIKKPQPPQTDVLTDYAEGALQNFFAILINAADDPKVPIEMRQKLAFYRDTISPIIEGYGEEGVRGLARAIAYPRLTSLERQQLSDILEQLTRLRNNPSLYRTRLMAIPQAQQIKLLAFLISNSLLADEEAKELILLSGKIDINQVRDAFVKASKRNDNEWIRTASIVISRPLGRFEILSGGHNVNSAVTSFKTSRQVPIGTIRTVRRGNRLTFLVNPSDVKKVPMLIRKAAILTEGKELTPQAASSVRRTLQADMGGTPPPIRPVGSALLMPPDPPPMRGFNGGGGWRREQARIPIPSDEAAPLARHGEVAVSVEKRPSEQGFEYTITTVEGNVIKAYSTPSAIDALVGLGRSVPKENPKVAFILKGFSEGEAQGFLFNADLRLKKSPLTGFVKRGESIAYRTRAVEYNLPQTRIGEHSIKRIPEGRYKGLYELNIDFSVPAQASTRPSLKVRLQILFRNAISDPTIAGVKNAIRRFFGRPIPPDSKMNSVIEDLAKELRTTYPDAKNILTIWDEDTGGIFIVELRVLQRDESNPRENSKSE